MAFGKVRSGSRDENDDYDPRLSHIDHVMARNAAKTESQDYSTAATTPKRRRQTSKRNSTLHLHDAIDDPTSDLQKFLDTKKSLRSTEAMYYSLALEPFQERKERICQLAEAYALFGALFLNGIYFVWEYGVSNEFENETLKRIFEVLCAIGLFANLQLAMFAAFLWFLSVLYSATEPDWVYACRFWLADMTRLQMIIFTVTFLAAAIGIYNRLKEHFVDAIVLVIFVVLSNLRLLYTGIGLIAQQCALETFHFPLYMHLFMPFYCFFKPSRVKELAQLRAEVLKKRLGKETVNIPRADLEALLKEAAAAIGKPDADVTPYMLRLADDWYETVESLKKKDVDILKDYMPRGLAESVYEILQQWVEIHEG